MASLETGNHVDPVEHPFPLVTIYETQTDAPRQIEAVDMAHYLAQSFEREGLKGGDQWTPIYYPYPVGDEWRETHGVPPPLLPSTHPDYQVPEGLEADNRRVGSASRRGSPHHQGSNRRRR